jgi:hypothetical protein
MALMAGRRRLLLRLIGLVSISVSSIGIVKAGPAWSDSCVQLRPTNQSILLPSTNVPLYL